MLLLTKHINNSSKYIKQSEDWYVDKQTTSLFITFSLSIPAKLQQCIQLYTDYTGNSLSGNCKWSSKLSVQKTKTLTLEWTGGGWRAEPIRLRPEPLVLPGDKAEDLSKSKDKVRGLSPPRPPFPVLSEILRSYQPVQKMYNKLLAIHRDLVWTGGFITVYCAS